MSYKIFYIMAQLMKFGTYNANALFEKLDRAIY